MTLKTNQTAMQPYAQHFVDDVHCWALLPLPHHHAWIQVIPQHTRLASNLEHWCLRLCVLPVKHSGNSYLPAVAVGSHGGQLEDVFLALSMKCSLPAHPSAFRDQLHPTGLQLCDISVTCLDAYPPCSAWPCTDRPCSSYQSLQLQGNTPRYASQAWLSI